MDLGLALFDAVAEHFAEELLLDCPVAPLDVTLKATLLLSDTKI